MAVTSDPTSRGYGATASPQVRISTSAAGTSATISCQVLLLHRSLSIGERRRLAYLRHGIRVLLGEEHNAAGGHDQHVAQHRGVRPFSCSRRRPSVCSGVGRSSARDNPRRPGRSRTRRERASGAAECCGAVRNLLFAAAVVLSARLTCALYGAARVAVVSGALRFAAGNFWSPKKFRSPIRDSTVVQLSVIASDNSFHLRVFVIECFNLCLHMLLLCFAFTVVQLSVK